ncbi:zinc metalloprotease [Chaetoceros tenuissimus]|uniref:Zinc metalloprotease n=1 Tax=Chaetoceros tenuissimus TaxID=426638 RepID=A0AAD3CZW5_9STRA|nr:zinc metalloprotease [Chaetoceros tenuissimus]
MRIISHSTLFMLAFLVGMGRAHDHHHHHHHHDDHRELEKGGDRRTCGTPDPTAEEQAQAQKAVENWRTVKAASAADGLIAATTTPQVIIPTYVHLIYGKHPSENEVIAAGDAQRQIDVMNDAFDGSGFSFNLIEVKQIQNPSWWTATKDSTEEIDMKSQTRVGGPEELNIWFNAVQHPNPSNILLGHARFPEWVAGALSIDGVVCLHSTKDGGSFSPFNEGDTLVHEVGHWLGLYHTFQGGCGSGDHVDDTPAEAYPAYGCPVGRDTCPSAAGLDPITNYMDYTDDDCMNHFTSGQSERMHAMWETYRLVPSESPSSFPSMVPSDSPSDQPSSTPSSIPSDLPSNLPSSQPSDSPSSLPSMVPSESPSFLPSMVPSDSPSSLPSTVPSDSPSSLPSMVPSDSPSSLPSMVPSDSPSSLPSLFPSFEPSWVDDEQCKKKDTQNDICAELDGRCKLDCEDDEDFVCVPGLCSYDRNWDKPTKSPKMRELKEEEVDVVDIEIAADGSVERKLKATKAPKSSCACRVPKTKRGCKI